MSKHQHQNLIKLQAKRNVELWIYSFADMYMILSVFFIAVAVLYAAKVKMQHVNEMPPTAGRGPTSVESTLGIDFEAGSADLTEDALDNLKLLLPVLKSAPGTIEIEGYADSENLKRGSAFTSNLELSNIRAVRVAEWIMKNGVAASKLRTYSYGNGRVYRIENETMKTNRRVLIKIVSKRSAS